MDWILALALATFALIVAFLLWSKISHTRHRQTGGNTGGIGGPNDPLSGSTPNIREGGALRGNLDAESGMDARPHDKRG